MGAGIHQVTNVNGKHVRAFELKGDGMDVADPIIR
jgi:hypothetical protein